MVSKKYSVFVQTDKSTYKPGDKVQFRVLVVDSETKPYRDRKVYAYITDGGQNRIKEYKNKKLPKGFFSGELQLSDQPPLGTWTIHVRVDDEGDETSKSFEVAEYILPKFEVIISTKSNVALDEKIRIGFKAKYTYGKEILNGTVTVSIESANSWDYYQARKFSKTQDLKEKDVEVGIKKDLNLMEIWYQHDLIVTVAVRDGVTGREQNSSTTITVFKNKFKIDVVGSEDDFKPNMPFTIRVTAKDLNKAPLTDLKTPVNVTVIYTYEKLVEEDSTTTDEPYLYFRPPKYVQKQESFLDFFKNGVTSISLTIPENVTYITALVRFKVYMSFFIQFRSIKGCLQRNSGILLGEFKTK
jgi:CD109 antigen